MTISEIAKMAGVSNAAVSRYLNNGSLSKEKQDRIREVIEETGYQPDIYARTLRTKKMNNIGVIVPKINSESVSEITAGISYVLSKHNYMLLLGNTNNDEMKELDFLDTMQRNQLAGIILMGTIFTPAHKKALKSCSIPIVIVGQSRENMPCIYHDDYHAARALAKTLLKKGRKKIAYIAVREEDIAVGKNRRSGVEDELNANGLKLVDIETSAFVIDSGYDAMVRLLEKNLDIDSVICATDTIAIGAMKAIQNAGYSIPEELSVAGFGGNKIGNMLNPALTTVKLFYRQAGIEAAKLLLDMIEPNTSKYEEDSATKQLMLSYELIERDSV